MESTSLKIKLVLQRGFVLILFCILCSSAFSQEENPKLKITQLAEDFYIYTTYNYYKGNPVPANGMYVVTNDGVVVFDSPWDTTQFQPLLDSIKTKHHSEVKMCIATHSHDDRTAGLEYYKSRGIRTYTTIKTDQISKGKGNKRAEFLLQNDTVFNLGQLNFQTFYGGAGHTPDNIVIWFPNEKVLYGGCLIKSTEADDLGNLNDANVKEWEKTIHNLQQKFKEPNFIIPGHGDWQNKQSLEHTLKLIRKYLRKSK